MRRDSMWEVGGEEILEEKNYHLNTWGVSENGGVILSSWTR